jgi:nicotinate-nucleotide--dimethylbenzimidazole phosphoribosyltransferase
MSDVVDDLRGLGPLDEAAMAAAQSHLDELTKPPGSLGRLEELAVWLAGVTGDRAPAVQRRAVIVAAADHGVARAHRVSGYPPEVTAQMVANFLSGGAAISVLARASRAEVVVIDVGVASPIPAYGRLSATGPREARFINGSIRLGTDDITQGPAMRPEELNAAIDLGVDTVRDLVADGVQLIAVGEMGIGNTTAASAIVAAITGRPAREVTGLGTGIDHVEWSGKVAAIERALEINRASLDDPLGVLRSVGGLEIATLVGVIGAAATRRIPVLLDGFITGAAALVARQLAPNLGPRLLASHRSTEPGHAVVLECLGLRPLLELDLRLGEGTGAALAMLLIDAAIRVRDEMATFVLAGVDGRLSRSGG